MPIMPERMEIRVIGTDEQLERAAELIKAAYDVHYESDLYDCQRSAVQHRQYYRVTEKESVLNGQDDKADS